MAIKNEPKGVYMGVQAYNTQNMSMSSSGDPATSAVRPDEYGDFLMYNIEAKSDDEEYRPRLTLGTHHCGLRFEAAPFAGNGQLQLTLGAWPKPFREQKPGHDPAAENDVDTVSWDLLRGTYNDSADSVQIVFQRNDMLASGTTRYAPYLGITVDANGVTFDVRAVDPATGNIITKRKTLS